MPVHREVIFALVHDGTGILQPLFCSKFGDNRIRYRPDGALLGNRCAEHALHPARGQEQRQVVQRGKAARRDRAFTLCTLLKRIERGPIVRHQVGAQITGRFLRAA